MGSTRRPRSDGRCCPGSSWSAAGNCHERPDGPKEWDSSAEEGQTLRGESGDGVVSSLKKGPGETGGDAAEDGSETRTRRACVRVDGAAGSATRLGPPSDQLNASWTARPGWAFASGRRGG